MTEVAL